MSRFYLVVGRSSLARALVCRLTGTPPEAGESRTANDELLRTTNDHRLLSVNFPTLHRDAKPYILLSSSPTTIHGQAFRASPLHCGRGSHTRWEEHAGAGSRRAFGRPARHRAGRQSISESVLRRRARRSLPGTTGLPNPALRATAGARPG